MDLAEITRRLDSQDRLLHAIAAALAPDPMESENSGFDDLISVLADLTEAVADVTSAVRGLHSGDCARCRQCEG